MYIGLNIHALTRSKKLIKQLHRIGISISYDRVLELEDSPAISVCEGFIEDGVIAPTCLRKGLFTVGAIDNLDHNPSSTTSTDSFHGTGICLLQFPAQDKFRENRPPIVIPPVGNKGKFLHESYSCCLDNKCNCGTKVSVEACRNHYMLEQGQRCGNCMD